MFASRFFTRSRRRIVCKGQGFNRKFSLISLEERSVPANMMVTNTADNGSGSLRQAVMDANAAVGPDNVIFDPGVAGTITLTSGSLGINGTTSIIGPGANVLTINGNNNACAFDTTLAPSSTLVEIAGLTITNCHPSSFPGGAVRASFQNLIVTDCIIDHSTSGSGGGGGIYLSGGNLTVSGCTITNNTGINGGGGIEFRGGDLSVNGSTIANNIGRNGNGISFGGANLTVTNCIIANNNNNGVGLGGGIYASKSGSTVMTVTVTGCVIDNNNATFSGGGIHVGGGTLTMRNSEVRNNSAGNGGGVYSVAGGLLLENCTLSSNNGGNGGGLDIRDGAFPSGILRNCTVSGNSGGSGGGILLDYFQGTLQLQNCTVTGNSSAGNGGGIGQINENAAKVGNINIESCLVSGNTAAFAPDVQSVRPVHAAFSGIGSVQGMTSFTADATTSALIGQDMKIDPLADNGGPTRTHALLAGSPAVDAGSNPGVLISDQRGSGFNRVSGKGPDIGAFETQTTNLPTVAGVLFNDDLYQRSMISRVKIVFSEPVAFPEGIAAAFSLNRTGPSGPTGAVNMNFAQSGNVVTVIFTLGGPVGIDPSGSLIEGHYSLTLIASKIQGANGFFDSDGNGTGGDDRVMLFHRLFGDADGNGIVDGLDFAAFRSAFNTDSSIFDFDGNGITDGLDFGQFRQRFGMTI